MVALLTMVARWCHWWRHRCQFREDVHGIGDSAGVVVGGSDGDVAGAVVVVVLGRLKEEIL